jgi:hypothetical protein
MNEPFERFWNLYPRRIAHKKAEQSWRQIPLYKHSDVIEGLKKHLIFWKQQGTEKQFIPYPATWLNQERWKDEIELAPEMPQCDWNRNGTRDSTSGRCPEQAVKEHDRQFYCAVHCSRMGLKVVRG